MLQLPPHHDGSALYVSNPAPALGETVTIFVRALVDRACPTGGVERVYARSAPDGEPAFVEATVDRTVHGEQWWRAELSVVNPVTNYRFLLRYRDGSVRWLNALGLIEHDVPDAHDFRLLAYAPPPEWSRDAVVYEIFPDRFARSAAAANRQVPDWAIGCDWDTPVIGSGPETPIQFYGGDLDGVTEHLDHVQGLGATAIYLTPVFPARSNHRYNASSFATVDPLLGGDEALVRLSEAVHARGMRLLGDITSNHTGDDHDWFLAAAASSDAPEREMYYFTGDDYEAWWGIKTLPKLNWGSAELRHRFFDGPESVVARWLRPPYNLDGWRVDVANMTGRLRGDQYNHEVSQLLRKATVDTRSDGLIVAEHTHDATGDMDRDGWHGYMNQSGFLRPLWSWLRREDEETTHFLGAPGPIPKRSARATVATMRAFAALVSWRTLTHSWNLLCSHDTTRVRTIVGTRERVEVAAGLLMSMPGTPMIFAGDEWGMTGFNGEDARRPIQWDRPGDTETLAFYRKLIALRRGSEALRHGGLRWVGAGEDWLSFIRETARERVLIYARRAAGEPPEVAGLDLTGAEPLYGGADGWTGDGPSFHAWRLR